MQNKQLEHALEIMGTSYVLPVSMMLDLCQSPIEKLLLVRLYGARVVMMDNMKEYIEIVPQHEELIEIDGKSAVIHVDFAILVPNKGIKIAIECDGHEFHTKTKQQVNRDNARDFGLQQKGISIIRLSGNEIHTRADACVLRVWALLETLLKTAA